MTKEELLKPRYKVIADYPGSPYKIGDILFYMKSYSTVSYLPTTTYCDKFIRIENYPHIFRKLEWWEEREEQDMPEYVKYVPKDKVLKVADKSEDCRLWHKDNEVEFRFIGSKNFLPSTKEEYESQNKK